MLRIEIWSDIACPWCYIGKRRLEAALEQLRQPERVELIWRSFELDPSAPAVYPEQPTYTERLARKFGTSIEQAQAMMQRVSEVAATEGLHFRLDRVRGGNTFDAHRLLHLARARGVQPQLKERLLRAYFTEGASIGDRATLLQLAVEAGLGVDEVSATLQSDDYADAVRADERTATQGGIRGVPFFRVGRYPVEGAQPSAVLFSALQRASQDADVNAPGAPDAAGVCTTNDCS